VIVYENFGRIVPQGIIPVFFMRSCEKHESLHDIRPLQLSYSKFIAYSLPSAEL
jgi:hypothetical protein